MQSSPPVRSRQPPPPPPPPQRQPEPRRPVVSEPRRPAAAPAAAVEEPISVSSPRRQPVRSRVEPAGTISVTQPQPAATPTSAPAQTFSAFNNFPSFRATAEVKPRQNGGFSTVVHDANSQSTSFFNFNRPGSGQTTFQSFPAIPAAAATEARFTSRPAPAAAAAVSSQPGNPNTFFSVFNPQSFAGGRTARDVKFPSPQFGGFVPLEDDGGDEASKSEDFLSAASARHAQRIKATGGRL